METIRVKFKDNESKYLSIYKEIKNCIVMGSILHGEKLPSKRQLAKILGVSVNTIMNAYNLLLDEEYIVGKEKSGYFVSSNKHFHVSDKNFSLADNIKSKVEYDFSSENVAESSFPFYTFKKVTADVINNNPNIWLTKSDPIGDIRFRSTLADYLFQNKGMNVTYRNIIIVSSLENSLGIINNLINPSEVAIEKYCYQKVPTFFKNKGKRIIYLDSDNKGIIPNNEKVDLLYTTPYNQFPLGIVMSSSRKDTVLKSSARYILEDDYDCDLLLNKKIVTTLYSLDNQKVFYHGSFSHSICPGIRLSYLVIPNSFIDTVEQMFMNYSSTLSSIDQAILNKFINEGFYFRHLNKLKKYLANIKQIVKEELNKIDGIEYTENPLSFVIKIKYNYDREKLEMKLEKNGIRIKFMSSFSYNFDDRLLLCFSSFDSQKVVKGISKLKECIEYSKL